MAASTRALRLRSVHSQADAAEPFAAGEADVKKQLRQAKWMLKAVKRRERDYAARVAEIAFALVAKEWPETACARAFVAAAKKKPCGAALDDATLERVAARHAATAAATLLDIASGIGGLEHKVLQEAQQFWQDWKLRRWVEAQNVSKGLAPTSALLVRHLCANAPQYTSLGNTPWNCRRGAAAKKWLQRFRRRWQLVRGRFPARDKVPLETLRLKAGRRKKGKAGWPSPPPPNVSCCVKPFHNLGWPVRCGEKGTPVWRR